MVVYSILKCRYTDPALYRLTTSLMPPLLITTKIKDDTLQWLCANVPVGQIVDVDKESLAGVIGVDDDAVTALIKEFGHLGLVDQVEPMRVGTVLALTVKAHDLLLRGGFAVMDALNEANIQKLLYELDVLKKQLQPDQTETLNEVTTIMASIATVAQAFSDKS